MLLKRIVLLVYFFLINLVVITIISYFKIMSIRIFDRKVLGSVLMIHRREVLNNLFICLKDFDKIYLV